MDPDQIREVHPLLNMDTVRRFDVNTLYIILFIYGIVGKVNVGFKALAADSNDRYID